MSSLRLLHITFVFFVAGTAMAVTPSETASEINASEQEETPKTCTYSTYEWSLAKKGPVNRRTVKKAYAKVTDAERDPLDPRCTVCAEDQRTIELAEVGFEVQKSIKICRHYSDSMERALKEIASEGIFKISDVIGYRVGKTRGPVVDDKRTRFSAHSFGTAIDINAKFNGMYSRCNIKSLSVKTLKKCKLAIGGHWNPKRNPRHTITQDGIVYKKITEHIKWRWGGEISGKIKDLMHFSINGY